jgi:hypothetical protein
VFHSHKPQIRHLSARACAPFSRIVKVNLLGFPMDSIPIGPRLKLEEQDREQAAHAVKSRCKLGAKANSWFVARLS